VQAAAAAEMHLGIGGQGEGALRFAYAPYGTPKSQQLIHAKWVTSHCQRAGLGDVEEQIGQLPTKDQRHPY
jgi:hypothetical protein